jgi:DNA-binding XRE family transcriptional regulator
MATFVGALRSEVRRLTVLEVRKAMRFVARLERQLQALRATARQHIKNAARLERSLRRFREQASGQTSLRGRGVGAADGPPIPPREVRAFRAGLGLSRHKFGDLLGVSHGTVYLWEAGRVEPRGTSRAKYVAAKRKYGQKAGLARGRTAAGPRRQKRRHR